ncbi:MAG: excinuclease ABC subunit UvrA, partial [Candidatus Eiseniibacteriota bacterium]
MSPRSSHAARRTHTRSAHRAAESPRALTDIVIRGAREHNLRNLDLRLPRQSLVVITGVSGSGKSSLAFDTLYAEGQRRYVESLSAYARQFLGQMEKPDVDSIEGLSPAIAIEQRGAGSNPRSTVATITEIYDYLRLLYARLGEPHCPNCDTLLRRQSVQEIVDLLSARRAGERVALLAPIARGRKGEYRKEFETLLRQGYLSARVDGAWIDVESPPVLKRHQKHDIDAVVDRLTIQPNSGGRLAESVEAALRLGGGLMAVVRPEVADDPDPLMFSQGASCPNCGTSIETLEPRSFSFNSPFGACPACDGLGTTLEVDAARVVPDSAKSITDGAIAAWGDAQGTWVGGTLKSLARKFDFSLKTPWRKLPARVQRLLLHGSGDEKVRFEYRTSKGSAFIQHSAYEGILPSLKRRYRETSSEAVRRWIGSLMVQSPCAACGGRRLRPASLAVRLAGRRISDWTSMPVRDARLALDTLRFEGARSLIAAPIVKEIASRLGFLDDVGLGYLALNRSAGSLAGGEAQRIRLATQIGSQLTGVLYILDEPSIGLHPRDMNRIVEAMHRLRDAGNTLVVVEHDEETIRHAAHVIDLGPGGG